MRSVSMFYALQDGRLYRVYTQAMRCRYFIFLFFTDAVSFLFLVYSRSNNKFIMLRECRGDGESYNCFRGATQCNWPSLIFIPLRGNFIKELQKHWLLSEAKFHREREERMTMARGHDRGRR